jgi:hypothetical protein
MFQRLPDGTYWKSKVVNRELTFEKVRGDEERCSALFARLTLQQEAEHLEAERRRERERERKTEADTKELEEGIKPAEIPATMKAAVATMKAAARGRPHRRRA